ncbi:MAG TPA: hypothetical protein PLU88_11775, partial [Armatimonadota bacterium]|nr:hypothetical protein [Armatimonadota bacterium]HOP80898.1 hypothetical protein [Armatimonadota bacterium]HPP75790.1 hypothetical protein [Armatimonadota bacterium]
MNLFLYANLLSLWDGSELVSASPNNHCFRTGTCGISFDCPARGRAGQSGGGPGNRIVNRNRKFAIPPDK